MLLPLLFGDALFYSINRLLLSSLLVSSSFLLSSKITSFKTTTKTTTTTKLTCLTELFVTDEQGGVNDVPLRGVQQAGDTEADANDPLATRSGHDDARNNLGGRWCCRVDRAALESFKACFYH